MINTRNHLLRDLENPPVDEEEKKTEGDSSCDVLEGEPSESKPSYTDTYKKVHELQKKLNQNPFSLSEDKRDESGASKRERAWGKCSFISVCLMGAACLVTGYVDLTTGNGDKDVSIGLMSAGASLVIISLSLLIGLNKKVMAKPCLRKSRNFFFAKNVVPKLEASDRDECKRILKEINWGIGGGDKVKKGINFLASQMDFYKEAVSVVTLPPPLVDVILDYLDVPAAIKETPKLSRRR